MVVLTKIGLCLDFLISLKFDIVIVFKGTSDPTVFLRFAATFLNSFLSSDRPEITVTPEPFLPFFSKNILKAVLEFNLDRSFLHLHFRKVFCKWYRYCCRQCYRPVVSFRTLGSVKRG